MVDFGGLIQKIEHSKERLERTAFMLTPAFLGFAKNPLDPQSNLTALAVTAAGGVAGYILGRDQGMGRAGVFAILSMAAGVLINTLAGIQAELTSPIIDLGVGVAVGLLSRSFINRGSTTIND